MPHSLNSKQIYLRSFFSFGMYFFYWCAKSRQAINSSAKQILVPTAWMLAIPGLNFFWMWQYTRALEAVSYKRIKANDVFLVFVLVSSISATILSFGQFFLPTDEQEAATNPDTFWAFFIACVIGALIAQIIGVSFFCAYAQKKSIRQFRDLEETF